MVPNCEQNFVNSSRLKWYGDAGLSAGPQQESDTSTKHLRATIPTRRSSSYRGNTLTESKVSCSTDESDPRLGEQIHVSEPHYLDDEFNKKFRQPHKGMPSPHTQEFTADELRKLGRYRVNWTTELSAVSVDSRGHGGKTRAQPAESADTYTVVET